MKKFENATAWMLGILLVTFIAIFPSLYIWDHLHKTSFVTAITVCRVLLFFTAIAYLAIRPSQFLQAARHQFSAVMIVVIGLGGISFLLAPNPDLFDAGRHLFQYSFMILLFLVGRSVDISKLGRVIGALSLAAIVSYAVAAGLVASHPALHAYGNYSFQPNLLLGSISLGLSQSSFWQTGLSTALVLVGNKRAVLIGALIIFAVFTMTLLVRANFVRSFSARASSALCLTMLLVYAVPQILALASAAGVPMLWVGNRMAVAAAVDPISQETKRHDDVATIKAEPDMLLKITSARNIEVEATAKALEQAYGGFAIGAGLGASYEMAFTSPFTGEKLRYVRIQADVLAAHVALTSGILAAALMSISLIWIGLKAFSAVHTLEGNSLALSLFTIGLLPDIFLGFNATNPIIWAAIGVATATQKSASAPT